MTLLRRLSQLVVTAVIAIIAVMLILEVTSVIDGDWRGQVAELVETASFPGWPLWVSALVGATVGVAGIVVLIAQLAPPRRGLSRTYPVHKGDDGETWLRGRAAINAVRHELLQVEGVLDVDARLGKSHLDIELSIDDRSVVTDLEGEARRRVDHQFWADLGLSDLVVNLLLSYQQRPPRVR
jgi:hypothetical protein